MCGAGVTSSSFTAVVPRAGDDHGEDEGMRFVLLLYILPLFPARYPNPAPCGNRYRIKFDKFGKESTIIRNQ